MARKYKGYTKSLSPYNKYIKPIVSCIDKDVYKEICNDFVLLRKQERLIKSPAFLLKSEKEQAMHIEDFYYLLLRPLKFTPFYDTWEQRKEGFIDKSDKVYGYETLIRDTEKAMHGVPKKYRSVIEGRRSRDGYIRTPIGFGSSMNGAGEFLDNDPAIRNIVPKRGKSQQVRDLIADLEHGGILHRYNLDEIRDMFIEIFNNIRFETFDRNPRGNAKGSNIVSKEMLQTVERKDKNIEINAKVKKLRKQQADSVKRARADAHADAAAMREQMAAAKKAVQKAKTLKELTQANQLLTQAIQAQDKAVKSGKSVYFSNRFYDGMIAHELKKAKAKN